MKNLVLIIVFLNLEISAFTQVNVMAPLHVMVYNNPSVEEDQDWTELDKYLHYANSVGVKAISVDVWWGLVQEGGKDTFDWSYYKKLFEHIKSNNLQIIPIMSFHQCGGNVNDNYTKRLPSWIWEQLKSDAGVNDVNQFKYVSPRASCDEYISLWIDKYVLPYYSRFISEFIKTFNDYHTAIPEINIS